MRKMTKADLIEILSHLFLDLEKLHKEGHIADILELLLIYIDDEAVTKAYDTNGPSAVARQAGRKLAETALECIDRKE